MEFPIWIVHAYLSVMVLGGITAYFKGDYITRGIVICLITGILGLVIMIISPRSKALTGDEHDKHYWPRLSWLALAADITVVLILLIKHWLFS